MEIYVLRHAEAEERETGLADRDRKLTAKGKRDLKDVLRVARKAEVAPDLILTSPLRRAQETAAIAAEVLGCKTVGETRNLLPGASPEQIWKEIGTPARLSVLHSAVYEKLPFSSVIQTMLKHSTFTPPTKIGAGVDTACITALGPLWLGQQTAVEATKNADAALKTALAGA